MLVVPTLACALTVPPRSWVAGASDPQQWSLAASLAPGLAKMASLACLTFQSLTHLELAVWEDHSQAELLKAAQANLVAGAS